MIKQRIDDSVIKNIAAQLVRPDDAYKNMFGTVLIMAGSVGMAGAAVLCGRSALRTGSGLVRYCAPQEIRDILQISVPEATCLPRTAETISGEYQAIAPGPGLGCDRGDAELLRQILTQYQGKLILDADALNDITRFELIRELRDATCEVVVTPHIGEARRLLETNELPDSNEETALAIWEKYHVVTVLKGHHTLITDGNRMMVNTDTGNPGMATGGSGDVLTGVIASLAGQGLSLMEAATLGVYAHGFAGDKAEEKYGRASMIAGDICDALPYVFKKIIQTDQ